MIKVVFLDFDQTLYSHYTNCIPASAVKGLNALHDKGIKVVLCSGRAMYEMKDFDLSMIHLDGMIANNGQIAYDENNNVLFDNPITGKLKDVIVKKFNEKIIPIFIDTEDDIFANIIDRKVSDVQTAINSPNPKVKAYENEKFYMISAFYSGQDDFGDLLELKDLANITYWHDGAIDIIPKDASKAVGIEKYIKLYGLKQEETMCFGDSDNDIEMLQYCHISVAVGNGSDETKKNADYITNHIDEDGIYNALVKYELI